MYTIRLINDDTMAEATIKQNKKTTSLKVTAGANMKVKTSFTDKTANEKFRTLSFLTASLINEGFIIDELLIR